MNNNGIGLYQLTNIISKIKKEDSRINVIWSNFIISYEINWFPTFAFIQEQCRLEESNDSYLSLLLKFFVEGPPDSVIRLKITDNQFNSHGQESFPIEKLQKGSINIQLDSHLLKGSVTLYCTASTQRTKLDSLEIFLLDTTPEEIENQLLEEARKTHLRITSSHAKELLDLIPLLEDMDQEPLIDHALHEMYSIRCLDEVYQQIKSGEMDSGIIDEYFLRFNPEYLPNIYHIPIAKLKKCCVIPAPELQAACSEALIMRGDGVGVEHIIEDLLVPGEISWERGLEILSRNEDCTIEMVRDMVRWDDLEKEDDAYIEVMINLSKIYHPQLSRRARAAKDWKQAIELNENKNVIERRIIGQDMRGLSVPLGLIVGKVPIEEIDTRYHSLGTSKDKIRKRLIELVNKSLHLVVIYANRREGELILSETKAREIIRKNLLGEITAGDKMEGTVTNVTKFGVFVDIGGMDGLVHKSELSWEKDTNPSDILAKGDHVQVLVTEVDLFSARVNLSLKRLTPNLTLMNYDIGQIVDGEVTGIKDYGIFVKVDGKIDGFVHKSELGTNNFSHPSELVALGDKTQFIVLNIDENKHRLVLSLKQVGEDTLYWGNIRITRK